MEATPLAWHAGRQWQPTSLCYPSNPGRSDEAAMPARNPKDRQNRYELTMAAIFRGCSARQHRLFGAAPGFAPWDSGDRERTDSDTFLEPESMPAVG